MKKRVVVLGGGAWGITLSILLHRNGHEVILWTRSEEKAQLLRSRRGDPGRLPGAYLPESVTVTSDLSCVEEGDYILFVVPSHALRDVASRVATFRHPPRVISATKGLEIETGKRMSQVLREELGPVQIAVLSGPSIAREVVEEVPTSVVMASRNEAYAWEVQALFHGEWFRVYVQKDVVGVELGGALKNVMAIAAGMVDGMGLGINAKSALLTRALHEMVQFGLRLGAEPMTFAGLSGMGDLIVTAFSRHSRNRHVGEALGEGASLDRILAGMTMVAEGVKTTEAAYRLSVKHGIRAPLTHAVHAVLYEGKTPQEVLKSLLERQPRVEFDFSGK